MSKPYRDCLVELYAWAKRTSSHYYRTADVLDRTRILLTQPEPPELTDYDLDNLASEFLDWNREGLRAFARAAIAADRARRHPQQSAIMPASTGEA
jgi:hypothetical protein